MSPHRGMLWGFAAANLAIMLIALTAWQMRPEPPPTIQGVLIQDTRALPSFSLIDQHSRTFSNTDLLGRWHLVSYGFTTCPDICPTTLSQLSGALRELDAEERDDLQVLFYSVDHRRDTSERLATYMPFFNSAFLGLTHVDDADNPHLPFERGLGIIAKLEPILDESGVLLDDYRVSHGVTLFLINPRGELQAIFKPDEDRAGNHSFDPDTLLRDYRAVRAYLG